MYGRWAGASEDYEGHDFDPQPGKRSPHPWMRMSMARASVPSVEVEPRSRGGSAKWAPVPRASHHFLECF